MKWIAMYSQTGSEIVDICENIKRKPNLILTNNIIFNQRVLDLNVPIVVNKHDVLMNYLRYNSNILKSEKVLITLHGYLRIIPEDICTMFDMFNGHPGLITHYPELKGKDPQVRAWEGNYPVIGSVVHHVTPGVDEGDVINAVGYTNICKSLEEIYCTLKKSSLESWLNVLNEFSELGCELE